MTSLKTEANTQTSPVNISGSYDGDISILYFMEDWQGGTINDVDSFTLMLDQNKTNLQNYIFSANTIEIEGYSIHNGTGIQVLANNLSAQENISKSYLVAQEFSFDSLSYISYFRLFLNYSLIGRYILYTAIVDSTLSTVIDSTQYWIYSSSLTTFSNWISFYFYDNLLQPSTKYYLVFEVENITLEPYGGPSTIVSQNYWKAEFYNSSIFNKGETLIHNGSAWTAISNDDQKDMLCEIDYTNVIDPRTVDLRIYIDNQLYLHSTQIAPWGGGYEIYYLHTLQSPPTEPINLTISMNSTIQNIQLQCVTRYLYYIPAFGTYNTSFNKIDWEIIYPHEYVDGAFGFPGNMFAFEYDWNFIDLYDADDAKMTNIYFGPMTYNNSAYYAMFSLFMGPGLQPGNYTGRFTSPNYCHTINAKVKSDGIFQEVSEFELGQTVQLEAFIEDSNNNPISGGYAVINFTSPTGQLIHSQTSISCTNGIINTTSFIIGDDFELGTYTVTVFWTNGCEIGFYTMQIEVVAPPSWFWLIFLLSVGFGLAIAAIPLASYSRRKIQMRNWEKHLQNLFVLSKDGRSIYGYTFGIEIQDPTLISAALMAITNFITDAVKSKKQIKVIDLQDKKVILSHGNYVTTALIAAKDFPIIIKRTEQFTEAFETQYGDKIAKWRGDSSAFKGTDKIIQEYFPVSMEERITRGVKMKLIEVHERLESATEPEVLISIMREITQLLQRYRNIIEEHYMDEYTKLMSIFDQKISNP